MHIETMLRWSTQKKLENAWKGTKWYWTQENLANVLDLEEDILRERVGESTRFYSLADYNIKRPSEFIANPFQNYGSYLYRNLKARGKENLIPVEMSNVSDGFRLFHITEVMSWRRLENVRG